MADLKIKYPATTEDTVDLTITLASLASDTSLLAGRESTAVDNTTNRDLDHMLCGLITTGTGLTDDRRIEVWVYGPIEIASGTPTYPGVLDGTDSDESIASAEQKYRLALAARIRTNNTSNLGYPILPTSVADLFGGIMPAYWGAFVVHNTVGALNATGSNHALRYHRIQSESV